jgi:type II secretory pathway pseudopilin PulG
MYVNIDCVEYGRDPETDEMVEVHSQPYEKVFLAKVRGGGALRGLRGAGLYPRQQQGQQEQQERQERQQQQERQEQQQQQQERQQRPRRPLLLRPFDAPAAPCASSPCASPLTLPPGAHHAALLVLHAGGPQRRGADRHGGVPLRPGAGGGGDHVACLQRHLPAGAWPALATSPLPVPADPLPPTPQPPNPKGRLLHHQRQREGAHRAGAHGDQPRVRV